MRAHDEVRVPVAAGVGAIRSDSPDLSGEVEDELRTRVFEEARSVSLDREVVVRAARHEDVVAVVLQPLDEVRAEEPTAACDGRSHTGERIGLSQSTRPIQRSRFSAYQAIVFAMPSSHEVCGSQPVSRFSFS